MGFTRRVCVVANVLGHTAAMLDPEANARRAKICARPLSRPGDLERAWKAAGLTDVVQDMLTIRMDFASFDVFQATIFPATFGCALRAHGFFSTSIYDNTKSAFNRAKCSTYTGTGLQFRVPNEVGWSANDVFNIRHLANF